MPSTHPYVHEAEKLTMVRMHDRGYSSKDIAEATGRGYSTVCRTLAKRRTTGEVVTRNQPIGRKRVLNALDVQVSSISYLKHPACVVLAASHQGHAGACSTKGACTMVKCH